MRVGLFLTNQHPLGTNMVAALDEQIRMVRCARDNGWDSVWVGHHYLTETMAMLQPVPYLARLAPEAGELTLGLGILLLALLNPVHVAETVASLDVVCRGRFVFGVGLGYRDVEYGAFGIPRGERVRRFEENLRVVQALWAEDRVDVDLPWCSLRGVSLAIRPVQRPRPPIWVAANNDRAVERAARLGDTWMINPHAALETIRRQLKLFWTARAACGRHQPDELPAMKEVFCARDRRTALDLARPYLGSKYRTYAAWGQDRALPGGESFDVPFEQLEDHRFVIGSPEDCLRQLLPWRDELGVDHLIFRTHWSGMPVETALGSMDLLSREVIPALRKRS
ncbi:MAG: LLM class flavin-dependent oxidoreductase [Chloroflexi bacterium]|nr:LLM class flavin-dependent oxidoreductase [Chloroflexota bacterium]